MVGKGKLRIIVSLEFVLMNLKLQKHLQEISQKLPHQNRHSMILAEMMMKVNSTN